MWNAWQDSLPKSLLSAPLQTPACPLHSRDTLHDPSRELAVERRASSRTKTVSLLRPPRAGPVPGTLLRFWECSSAQLSLWHSRRRLTRLAGLQASPPRSAELRLWASVRGCHRTRVPRPGSSWEECRGPHGRDEEPKGGHRMCGLRPKRTPGRERGPPPPTQVCGSPQADFRVVSNGRFCQKSLVCFVFLLDSREARGSCSRRRDKVTALPCSARSPFQGNASRTAGSVATEGLCSRLSAPLRDLVFLLLSGSKRTSCISNVLVIQGK